MKPKVIVNGAKGKMGSISSFAIKNDPELELVGEAIKGDNLAEMVKQTQANIVVDFTIASVALENAKLIVDSGARPVIGTSGFREKEVGELRALLDEKNLGGIIAPNFSISAVLMMKFAASAAKYLPDCEIIEYHHPEKEDSPSGTAVKTAELIVQAKKEAGHSFQSKTSKEIIPGSRGAELSGVNIHAVRLPGVIANQEVVFGGLAQTLTIKSDCLSRESFMPGVCLSCKKVMEIKGLVYGLESIL